MSSLYKDKGVYYMNFVYNGKRIRKSTNTSNKTLAKQILEIVQGRIVSNKFKIDDYKERNIVLKDFYKQYEEHCNLSKRKGSAEIDLYALNDFMNHEDQQQQKLDEYKRELFPGIVLDAHYEDVPPVNA
jgi:hypothetical protein